MFFSLFFSFKRKIIPVAPIITTHLMFINTTNALYIKPNLIMEAFSVRLDRLVEIRKNHGFSQAKVATILDIPQQQYCRYENGQNEIPVRHIVTLCRFYKISSDWLLGLQDET